VRTGQDAASVEPGLATKWTISPDGTSYTFELRAAKFSDGTPVTAEDVVFSLERAKGPESRWASFFKPIASVRATDPHTVVITLTKPFTPFLANLGLFSASIVPKHAVQAAGKGFGEHPVGSGPFMLRQWAKGSRLVLARNPLYWQAGKPRLAAVNLEVITEDNTRMLKVRAGEVDIADNVPFNQIASVRSSTVSVKTFDFLDTYLVLLNTTREPFSNVRFRQGLNYAVDKNAIIKSLLFGAGDVAPSYLPKMKYYGRMLQPYPYDVERAKALLKEAPVTARFRPSLLIDSGDSMQQQLAVVLQDALKKVDITLQITPVDAGTQWNTITKMDYDMALSYMSSDTIDPDQLTSFSVVNPGRAKAFYTGFHDDEVIKLYEQGRTMADGAARAEVYGRIQVLAREKAPFIFLYHLPNVYAVRNTVQGFTALPTGNYRLEDVSIVK
jgi:peptide/nickel transport system substrate-binding protein